MPGYCGSLDKLQSQIEKHGIRRLRAISNISMNNRGSKRVHFPCTVLANGKRVKHKMAFILAGGYGLRLNIAHLGRI